MTLEELNTILKKTGYPVAFKSFQTEQKVSFPNICYQETEANTFFADGVVYFSSRRITVALYCKHKNQKAETQLETVFDGNGIPWVKDAYYNEKQKCYEIDYEIEV